MTGHFLRPGKTRNIFFSLFHVQNRTQITISEAKNHICNADIFEKESDFLRVFLLMKADLCKSAICLFSKNASKAFSNLNIFRRYNKYTDQGKLHPSEICLGSYSS